MSTPIVTTSELNHVLSDYRLHLTGYDDSIQTEDPAHLQAQNPPNWPTDRHRIPSYRPVNRNLDPNERPRGSNPAEFIFINIMFTGVFLNAVSKCERSKSFGEELTLICFGSQWQSCGV